MTSGKKVKGGIPIKKGTPKKPTASKTLKRAMHGKMHAEKPSGQPQWKPFGM